MGFLRIPWAGAWLLKNALRKAEGTVQVSELKILILGRGPLKGLICSCPSTRCCQGHMTLPELLLMLWVPFKGGLGLQSADTAPIPRIRCPAPPWAGPVTISFVMDPWLLCTRALGLQERGIPGTVPQREAGAASAGVEWLGSLFSPPQPILPVRDSCMGD